MGKRVGIGGGLSPEAQRNLEELRRKRRQPAAPSGPPLVREPRGEVVPASFGQERLWLLEQLQPGRATYHIDLVFRVRGALDAEVLARSWRVLVARHEAVRTTFEMVDGQLAQRVSAGDARGADAIDRIELPAGPDLEARALARIDEMLQQPFDLVRGPLVRASLLRLAEQDHLLALVFHHSIADGWSLELACRELAELYAAFARGEPCELEESPIQYADWAVWQRRWLASGELERQLEYWKPELAHVRTLELPTDRPRPSIQSFRGEQLPFELPASLCARLADLARGEGATLYMVLRAAFDILIARHAGHHDFAVGTPIANRTRDEVKAVFGFFANTLALPATSTNEASFREVLARVKRQVLAAHQHQDAPFEKLVEAINPPRDLSRPPLFQVVFALERTGIARIELGAARGEALAPRIPVSKFELSLFMQETDGRLSGSFEYNLDLFHRATIARLAGHFRTVLETIVRSPDRRVRDLPWLEPREREQLLAAGKDTSADSPRTTYNREGLETQVEAACVDELFAAQAERTPDTIAVVMPEARASYRELAARARSIARTLIARDVQVGDVVAILAPRGVDAIAAMLAVMQVGGCYLPLDPEYPARRLELVVAGSGARILLHAAATPVAFAPGETIPLAIEAAACAVDSGEPPRVARSPELPAYMIYTSGSTGTPKGVVVPHRAVVHHLRWRQAAYPLSGTDRFLHKTSLGFDISVWEIFGTLAAGAQLVVVPAGEQRDAGTIARMMRDREVTVAHFSPVMLDAWLDEPASVECTSLRRVFCGGEPLTPELRERFQHRCAASLHHQYGPTETTIDVACWDCPPGDVPAYAPGRCARLPIGRPIAGATAFILDAAGIDSPIGLPGELAIGGAPLSHGYHGRPALTAERFVPDALSGTPGARLYRTGDLARWLADGTIELLGRVDHQVKLRGYRIELGEIEAHLRQHEAVEQAVATVREDQPGDRRIAAYVVPAARFARRVRGEDRMALANGLAIAQLNRNETEFLYRDIFERGAYLRHELRYRDRDVVFDVGSNIGLFSLFVASMCDRPRLFCFEPNARVCDLLATNLWLYDLDARVHRCGLSRARGRAELTCYRGFSNLSGLYANAAEDRELVRSFLRKAAAEQPGWTAESAEQLLDDAFAARTELVELRTLSDVIEEHAVDRIDILKINVEKAEHDVLAGLSESDWPKVQSVVMEVHDHDGRLAQLTSLLEHHGLEVVAERDWSVEQIQGIHYLYAMRRERKALAPARLRPQPPRRGVLEAAELRRFLAERLPDYMVPSSITLLDALPVGTHGKVDRAALPRPEAERGRGEPPAGPSERLVARLFEEILAVPAVSATSTFFELGGHSMLALRLLAMLDLAVGRRLSFTALFRRPSVRGLASALDEELGGAGDRVAELVLSRLARVRDQLGRPDLALLELLADPALAAHAHELRHARDAELAIAGRSSDSAEHAVKRELVEVVAGMSDPELAAQLTEWMRVRLEPGTHDDSIPLTGARRALFDRWMAQHRIDAARGEPLARRDSATAPTTPEQLALWQQHRRGNFPSLVNHARAFAIHGPLDARAMEQAVAALVARQPALRTAFAIEQGRLVQRVLEHGADLEVIDVSRQPSDARRAAPRARFAKLSEPHDVERAVFRAELVRLGEQEHVLLLAPNHITVDGFSWGVLERDLGAFYRALAVGRTADLPPLAFELTDFCFWQTTLETRPVGKRQLEHWARQVAGYGGLELPGDRGAPPRGAIEMALDTYNSGEVAFAIEGAEWRAVEAACGRLSCTPYAVIVTGFFLLLSRWSGRGDLCVLSSNFLRDRRGSELLIGQLNTPYPLRFFVDERAALDDVARACRDAVLEHREHGQVAPSSALASLCEWSRYNLNYQLAAADDEATALGAATLEPLPWSEHEERTAHDLAVFARQDVLGLRARLVYNAERFSPELAVRAASRLRELIVEVARAPSTPVAALPREP